MVGKVQNQIKQPKYAANNGIQRKIPTLGIITIDGSFSGEQVEDGGMEAEWRREFGIRR